MARPFRFALDPVLPLREAAVEAARAGLGQAVAARAAADAEVALARTAFQTSLADRAALPTTALALGRASAHDEAAADALARAEARAAAAVAAETRARRALADALRRRDVLQFARDEARSAHRAEALRMETAELDDLGTTRFATRARLAR